MRGRKPALRIVETAPKSTADCPAAPTWMALDAKTEWARAAPALHARGALSPDVLATLESYCIAAGMVREFEATLRREGRIVYGDDGPKTHPAFRMQGAAMREARLLAGELGLTRRAKAGGAAEGKADGWDDLLA